VPAEEDAEHDGVIPLADLTDATESLQSDWAESSL
jgi:hypothetical protein